MVAVLEFLERSIGPGLFLMAVTVMMSMLHVTEGTLQVLKTTEQDDYVLAEKFDGTLYENRVEEYQVVAEILSQPEYSVVVQNGARKISFRCLAGGEILVTDENRNVGPEVGESKKVNLYHAISLIDFSFVERGEYQYTVDYDDNGQVEQVVYVKCNSSEDET